MALSLSALAGVWCIIVDVDIIRTAAAVVAAVEADSMGGASDIGVSVEGMS